MLDHLSHAFHTFPVFGLVGLVDRAGASRGRGRRRPAPRGGGAWATRASGTERVAVLGPEEMSLGQAVRRVADVLARRPIFVPLPIVAHLLLARAAEAAMRVPLVSVAQVRILAEGVTTPLPFADAPPADLAPSTPFDATAISGGPPGARRLRLPRPSMVSSVTARTIGVDAA